MTPPALLGPTPSRSFGALVQQAGFLFDPLGTVSGRFAQYGDLYRVTTRDGPLFVARHPEHLREVLSSDAAKYTKKHSAFRQLSRVLGDGLLTSDGASWQRQRRMVQPAFGRARMEGYAASMTAEALRTVGAWADGETRDLSSEMMELTLRVVSRTLFGHDSSGDTGDVARAMATLQGSLLQADLLPRWAPSPWRARLDRAVRTLDAVIDGMIARRRREGAPEGPADLLQMLLAARDEEGDGRGLTRDELRDQLVTLFLAGHETTSHALTWTLYLLSQNPDAERALHAELDALGGRPPSLGDLASLPYTEQVIKESLRLYPPVYMVARQAAEDTTLGGHPVPRGSEVVLWIYMTHRDPRWFPEHAAFRPERFAPESEAALPRFAWVPFGAGPRACIGRAFAMIEAQLLLAVIAQRYRLSHVEGRPVVPLPRITLVPRGGMPMTLRRRGA